LQDVAEKNAVLTFKPREKGGVIMAPPKKNKYWQMRGTHGRKPKIDMPETLWKECCKFFEWVEANPLHEEKLFSYQGEIHKGAIQRMRAMTIEGLCLFIGIDPRTWRMWRDSRDDLIPIIERVEMICYEQKFTGAAADLLNPNIIARDLGLKDKTEHEHTGSLTSKEANPLEVATRLMSLMDKARKAKAEAGKKEESTSGN
jgi:hypothetical protein